MRQLLITGPAMVRETRTTAQYPYLRFTKKPLPNGRSCIN